MTGAILVAQIYFDFDGLAQYSNERKASESATERPPRKSKAHNTRCGSERIETEVRTAKPDDKAAKAAKASGKNRIPNLGWQAESRISMPTETLQKASSHLSGRGTAVRAHQKIKKC